MKKLAWYVIFYCRVQKGHGYRWGQGRCTTGLSRQRWQIGRVGTDDFTLNKDSWALFVLQHFQITQTRFATHPTAFLTPMSDHWGKCVESVLFYGPGLLWLHTHQAALPALPQGVKEKRLFSEERLGMLSQSHPVRITYVSSNAFSHFYYFRIKVLCELENKAALHTSPEKHVSGVTATEPYHDQFKVKYF